MTEIRAKQRPVTAGNPRDARRWALLLVLAFGPQTSAEPLLLEKAPVPGWPKLQIETHYVSRIAMRGFCFPVPAGKPIPETSLSSCARPDFWRGVCDIFIDVEYTDVNDLRGHEEKRCRGYDHLGSDQFSEALRVWRERGENRYAIMLDFEWLMFAVESPGKCAAGTPSCMEVIPPAVTK